MRYFLTPLAGLAAFMSTTAMAREAQLFDFTATPQAQAAPPAPGPVSRDAALGSNPFTELALERLPVAKALKRHFASVAGDVGRTAETPFARQPVYTPPAASFVPQHTRRQEVIGLATTMVYPPPFPLGGSFARCDGAPYAPAWWLSAPVEGRRALYYDAMAAIACEFGIPTALLDAVIAQESGYKSWVVSHAGAMGMMQLIPGTARLMGLAFPFEPQANMRAGARYLREQLDRFGRVDLALAAYNAGPFRKSLQEGRVPRIPETLNYVETILTNWGRLAPLEGSTAIDRGAIAASIVNQSRFRSVQQFQFAGLAGTL